MAPTGPPSAGTETAARRIGREQARQYAEVGVQRVARRRRPVGGARDGQLVDLVLVEFVLRPRDRAQRIAERRRDFLALAEACRLHAEAEAEIVGLPGMRAAELRAKRALLIATAGQRKCRRLLHARRRLEHHVGKFGVAAHVEIAGGRRADQFDAQNGAGGNAAELVADAGLGRRALAVDQHVAGGRAKAAQVCALVQRETGKLAHHVLGGDGIEPREERRLELLHAFRRAGRRRWAGRCPARGHARQRQRAGSKRK